MLFKMINEMIKQKFDNLWLQLAFFNKHYKTNSKNNSFSRKTNEMLSVEKLNCYIPSHIYFVFIFGDINL